MRATLLRPGFICSVPSLDNAEDDQVLAWMEYIAVLDLYGHSLLYPSLPVNLQENAAHSVHCVNWGMAHARLKCTHQWYQLASGNVPGFVHVLVHVWTLVSGEHAAAQSLPLKTGGDVFSRDSSHRFVPVCFPALLLVAAAAPEVHCAGCFFLGTGAFALPLKALVGSSLFKCTSPVVSDEPTSLLNISGWYSEAHCCRDEKDRVL